MESKDLSQLRAIVFSGSTWDISAVAFRNEAVKMQGSLDCVASRSEATSPLRMTGYEFFRAGQRLLPANTWKDYPDRFLVSIAATA